jgi:hypothetical protein
MIQRQINESNARQNTSREERESRSMAVPLVYLVSRKAAVFSLG